MSSISIQDPPTDLTDVFQTIFTDDLRDFVVKICRHFDRKVDQIFVDRAKRRVALEELELSEDEGSLESLADFIEKQFSSEFALTFYFLVFTLYSVDQTI
jgi:hypothetical protein